jgi:DNA-binding XRE family transcriptional regulator
MIPISSGGVPSSGVACHVLYAEYPAWSRPHVDHPDVLSVETVITSSIAKGRGPALEAARKRLAARIASDPQTLRELRLARGLSQADLAKLMKTSQPHIARLESGREEPTLRTLRRLADSLRTDVSKIASAFP